MSFTPLLILLLQTSVLLLTSLVVLRAARGVPAVRLAVGRIALLAVLGLIVLSPWTRQRTQPIVPIQWNPVSSEVVSITPAPRPTPSPHMQSAGQVVPPSTIQSSQRYLSEDTVVLVIWLLGCAAFAAHLGLGYWAVARARRTSKPVLDGTTLSNLEAAAKSAGIKVPRLVSSEDVAGPVVTGVFHPTIFLPADLSASAGPDEIGAVLRHEIAHIANGDLKWGLFYRIISIIAWPQPLIRALARPMMSASEELCDSHVLASGFSATSYADALLRLREALGTKRTLSLGIGVVSRKRGIATRIESILAKNPRRIRVTRSTALAISAGAAIAAFGVTLVFAVPHQTAYDHEPRQYHRIVRLFGPDGTPVTKAEAWLQLTGSVMKFRKLDVTPDGVDVSAENLPIHTRGELVVHAPGLSLGAAVLWPNPKPITEIRLVKASQISGTLRLPDGSAGSHLTVWVTHVGIGEPNLDGRPFSSLAPANPLHLTATSDANGAFVIGDVPPGARVCCDVDDDRYAQVGFDQEFKMPADGSPATPVIVLRQATEFTGRILRNGNPVSGIQVGSQSTGRNENRGWPDAVSDADGRYVLKRMPADTYNVALKLNDGQQTEFTAVAHEAVRVKNGQILSGLDFDLIDGAVIEGRLVDAAGNPVGDGQIGVYGPAHPRSGAWVQCTWTDSNGHYLLRVPSGEQYVYTMDQENPGANKTLTVQDRTRTELDLRL